MANTADVKMTVQLDDEDRELLKQILLAVQSHRPADDQKRLTEPAQQDQTAPKSLYGQVNGIFDEQGRLRV